ncbi:MAG: ABC transporter ATP-binding protein [Bacilli bacterium]|nr:ABC transporter ATP-binding protein [Bacilli bacterium]
MNNLILHCENLTKSFGKKKIIDNISFDISAGEIVGFVGMNGSGKTTIIKLILNLQHKDSGKIIINNFDNDINYVAAIKEVGAIVETPAFYENLSGRKNLKLKSKIYNISDKDVNEIIDLVGLSKEIDEKVSKYSLGMKQRLGIALSLLNNPKLLVLDEPTNGLDIEGFNMLREVLKKLQNKKVGILISSHILSELDSICNKICIIKDGKIIETLEKDYKSDVGNIKYIFEVSNTDNINLLFDNIIISKNKFEVICNKEFIPIIIQSLVKSNIDIYSVYPKLKTLEDKFLETIGSDYAN